MKNRTVGKMILRMVVAIAGLMATLASPLAGRVLGEEIESLPGRIEHGLGSHGSFRSSSLESDPGTWGRLADMPTPRSAASGAMAVANGKITVVGHHEANPGTGRVNEEYDPANDTWASKSRYPQSDGRLNLGNAVVDGEIYFFGGNNISNNYSTQNINKYNPATDVWTPDIASYPVPVSGLGAVAYGDAIYLFGGQNYNSPNYTAAYKFDPGTHVLTPIQDMPAGRLRAMSFVVDDKIWVVGGDVHVPGGSTAPIRTTLVYDPATDAWSTMPGLLPDGRIRWAGMLDNGGVYAVYSTDFPEVYRYRPEAEQWDLVSTAPLRQVGFGGVSIGNRIHLIGGNNPLSRLHQTWEAGYGGEGVENGVTVITHGFQFPGSRQEESPEWATEMARALRGRVGVPTRIYHVDADTGGFELDPAGDSSGDNVVVVFDWSKNSNVLPWRGYSEAAAESLYAALVANEELLSLNLDRLHLIGHSRGTVVNSEVAERLIASGRTVRQVTTLDPHDWGRGGLWTDFDVNEKHPEYASAGVWTWQGVEYADNYYQDDGVGVLFGRHVWGASNFQTQLGLSHSQVHEWYAATIPTSDAGSPQGWFSDETSCPSSIRTSPLARENDGFGLTVLGLKDSGAQRCPDEPQFKEPVRFFECAETLVNGDFRRGQSGWLYRGGGGTGRILGGNLLLFAGRRSSTWRRHGLFVVPSGATSVTVRYRAVRSGTLRLTLERYPSSATSLLRDIPFPRTGPSWDIASVALPPEIAGTTNTLTLEVLRGAITVLEVDAVGFVGCSTG